MYGLVLRIQEAFVDVSRSAARYAVGPSSARTWTLTVVNGGLGNSA